jgi:hypothetical protein
VLRLALGNVKHLGDQHQPNGRELVRLMQEAAPLARNVCRATIDKVRNRSMPVCTLDLAIHVTTHNLTVEYISNDCE